MSLPPIGFPIVDPGLIRPQPGLSTPGQATVDAFNASLDRPLDPPVTLSAADFLRNASTVAVGRALPVPNLIGTYIVTPPGESPGAGQGRSTSSSVVRDLPLPIVQGSDAEAKGVTPYAGATAPNAMDPWTRRAVDDVGAAGVNPMRSDGWTFSPRLIASNSSTGTVRSAAQNWAAPGGETSASGQQANLGFSLSGPRVILFGQIRPDPQGTPSLAFSVLAPGGTNSGGAIGEGAVLEKRPGSLSLTIPGSGSYDVPRAVVDQVETFVKAAAGQKKSPPALPTDLVIPKIVY